LAKHQLGNAYLSIGSATFDSVTSVKEFLDMQLLDQQHQMQPILMNMVVSALLLNCREPTISMKTLVA
jgi:hypothetical protein